MSISSQNDPTQPIRLPPASPALPASMARQVRDQDLGPVVGIYSSRPIGILTWLLITLAINATVLIPFIYGIWSGYQGYIAYGLAVVIPRSAGWLIVSLLAFLLIFLYLVRIANRSLVLCRRGIVFKRALFALLPERVVRAYHWNQVEGISVQYIGEKVRGLEGSTLVPHIQHATLYPVTGRPIRVRGKSRITSGILGYYCINGLADFCTRTKALLYKNLLPRMVKEFHAGGVIEFGPVSIDRQFLQIHMTGFGRKHTKFAWERVGRLTIEAGKLVIELQDGQSGATSYRIPVSRIPNVELLLELMDSQV